MFLILAIVISFSMTHTTLMAFSGWALRAGIAEVSFGLGLKIASVGRVTIRLWPFGGYVRYLDARLGDTARPDTQTYDALPLWKRLGLAVTPVATLLALCWAALGPRAWLAFVGGFEQLLRGALGPMTVAQSLLTRLVEVCTTEPLTVALALVWAKLCALNTVAVLIGPGTSLMGEVLDAIGAGQRRIVAAQYLAVLWVLAVTIQWSFATAWFAWTLYGVTVRPPPWMRRLRWSAKRLSASSSLAAAH